MLKHGHVLPQLLLPIGHVEAGSLKLGQVERGVDRARRDGTRGVRVVVGGRHRHGLLAVAVGGLEDGAGDVRPGLHGAGAGAVVGAVGGARVQHVEDGLGHVAREGQAAQLVVRDGDLLEPVLGVCDAVGQPVHGLDEVVALADDPGAAHDVVARAPGHGEVLLECDVCHRSVPSYLPCARYLASVASLAGRHQDSLATFVRRKGSGSAMELSLWLSAA